jgi:xylan 1,4-beta-xylosidase
MASRGRMKRMHRLSPWFLFLLVWTSFVYAAPCSYRNPVLAGDFPDPSVIRVGHDYYATATETGWAPLFSIAHSTDLVHWQLIGAVFEEPPAWSVSNYWAPELVHYRGKFYLYYTARKKDGPLCVAVAVADAPRGPYTDHGPLVCQADGSIDAAHFVDRDGQRYLVWKEDGNSRRVPSIIWMQHLAQDGVSLQGAPWEMIRNDRRWEGKVVEGPYVLAHGGWYYLFYSGNACCGEQCNYALGVARAQSLNGVWEKHPGNPILAGSDDWRCPGHGSIVEAADQRTYLLYHSYSTQDFVRGGRFGLLDEVMWGTDDWPSINAGLGPTVVAASSEACSQEHISGVDVDDFAAPVMSPAWQWPIGRRPHLVLAHDGGTGLELAVPDVSETTEAVIGKRAPPGKYIATTLVDMGALRGGTSAGLAAYANAQQLLALTARDRQLTLWSREGGREMTLARVMIGASKSVQLRMVRTPEAGFRFSFRIDEGEWQPVVTASGTDAVHKPNSNPVRIALLTMGAAGATARFKYLSVERW